MHFSTRSIRCSSWKLFGVRRAAKKPRNHRCLCISLGKPIVVKDCPDSWSIDALPYFAGFQILVNTGATSSPSTRPWRSLDGLGPAYLLDVVGMDTAHHVGEGG